MINLIKKDFITTLRVRTSKSILMIIAVVAMLSIFIMPLFQYIAPVMLPLVISYIVVINSFYYDSINGSEKFILALPVKKEDIVYSKYLFSLIIVFLSIFVIYLFYGGVIFDSIRGLIFQDVVYVLNIFFISIACIFPLNFKFGYGKMQSLNLIISIIVSIPISKIISVIALKMEALKPTVTVNVEGFTGRLFQIIDLKYVNFNTLTIVSIVIFIFSMYISLKIYTKKDIL